MLTFSLGILFRNVDDDLKSYSSSNVHSMIVPEEFGNDCSELLFGASIDNSGTSSTHYLKVEPIIIDAVTNDMTNLRLFFVSQNLHLSITSHKPSIVFIYIIIFYYY